ncbi:hypothetical protein MSI_26230 [Treponema sp. JC4]|uniref:hypothetical protein n=1 Tax=Treponema sp. JC4 TaxID=1124982 RepID=UPI00025B0B1F|nr:hypothetical protein [Treponema sp. JC4]EID83968.1 hypothetical protein MSI_26230 [Treponema sp. JC4]
MKKKSILGKLVLSPLYILKGIWDLSGQLEDEPKEDNNVTCKYCGLQFPSVKSLVCGECVFHPDGRFKGKHTVYEGPNGGKYYCTYCGREATSIRDLILYLCPFHPDGNAKGHCLPYEGSLKSTYTCKYCGAASNNIHYLCVRTCVNHPLGRWKGHHIPMR